MANVCAAIKAMAEQRREINPTEATAAMDDLMSGASSHAQTGAFLALLQQQALNPELLQACASSMASHASPCAPNCDELIDVVGTGGDGMDTFNVSTAAGIVLAACGLKCAKHGNRSASGNVGSADFLEALGCKIQLDGDMVATAVEEIGFGFLFAQMFHPSMKNVAAPRKELGIRTIFNLLGPLTNPAKPQLQVIGVGRKELGALYASLLKLKNVKHAMVVHSSEGLDELSPAAPTHVWTVKDGAITEKSVTPEDFGVHSHAIDLVQGGSKEERAALFRKLLGGEERSDAKEKATFDYIVINAAAALVVAGKAETLKEAATMAAKAMDSGEALKVLDAYVAITNRLVQ